tara:strand:- start:378 stop:917 length:540 start_codon:yes stop_codon:yes gene_type:complete
MQTEKIDSESYRLQRITERVFGVKIHSRRRSRPEVDARFVFSLIMKERGYGATRLGRLLNKNHATIIHYWKNAEWYMKTDAALKRKYDEVSQEFYESVESLNVVNRAMFERKIDVLEKKNKQCILDSKDLKLEVQQLRKEVEPYRLYKEILDLVMERARPKEMEYTKKKLNTFFNGLYS